MKSVQLRLAVYQPDIPQNVGAMIRLCSCFGIEIDIIGPCSFPFSKNVLRRTAMDYFEMAKIRHHTNMMIFPNTLLIWVGLFFFLRKRQSVFGILNSSPLTF